MGLDPERVPTHYLQRDGDDGEPEGADESMITDPQHWPIWLDEYTEYGTVKSIGGLIVRVLCCASFGWKALSQFTFKRRSCSPGVISFQTVKRSAISWRHPVADSRCRRGRKCGQMRLNTDRNRCACRGEVHRFIARSRCPVG